MDPYPGNVLLYLYVESKYPYIKQQMTLIFSRKKTLI